MVASASTTAFRFLLGAFGVVELLLMSHLVRRVRRDPPGAFTRPVVILSLSYGLIGVTALGAAVFRSGVLFVTMAGLTVTHVIVRTKLRPHGS